LVAHPIFTFLRELVSMTKDIKREVDPKYAEQKLFAARKALTHLVEMHANGEWQLHYKTNAAFAEVVRERSLAVDHWTEIVSKRASNVAPRLPTGAPTKSLA
jgi:hypothetical protein